MSVGLWRETLERFRTSKLRTFLTALGIVITSASMVFFSNLVGSAFTSATAGLRNLGANLIFVQPGHLHSRSTSTHQSSA
jgi:ABC-type antimicrobial peptide transport system permease subunit